MFINFIIINTLLLFPVIILLYIDDAFSFYFLKFRFIIIIFEITIFILEYQISITYASLYSVVIMVENIMHRQDLLCIELLFFSTIVQHVVIVSPLVQTPSDLSVGSACAPKRCSDFCIITALLFLCSSQGDVQHSPGSGIPLRKSNTFVKS